MIVTKEKSLEEILGFLEPYSKILIVGCDGCVQPPRGLREAKSCASLIEIAGKLKGKHFRCEATTICRQRCSEECLTYMVKPEGFDVILSLACGVGVQTLAEVFPDIPISPAQNTLFIGSEERRGGIAHEMCVACGNCVLHEMGGVCPVTRCAKGLLNGPCGGVSKGKCELGGGKQDCAWVLIFNRLKARGRLDSFTKFRPPRDYRVSQAPRELR